MEIIPLNNTKFLLIQKNVNCRNSVIVYKKISCTSFDKFNISHGLRPIGAGKVLQIAKNVIVTHVRVDIKIPVDSLNVCTRRECVYEIFGSYHE